MKKFVFAAVLIWAFISFTVYKVVSSVRDVGLKNIVNEVWEGKKK